VDIRILRQAQILRRSEVGLGDEQQSNVLQFTNARRSHVHQMPGTSAQKSHSTEFDPSNSPSAA